MELNQLRTLVRVAEVGSLSKAADLLCTAQPALSRQIRLLEQELRTRLFYRHGRGMLLTEQGRVVQQYAVRILAELDELRSSVASGSRTLRGNVSIGMPPTVSEVLAVPLLAAIRAAYPKITCRIVSAYSLYLLEWVHQGKIDIAILYDPQSIKSLKTEQLLEQELYVVAPANSGLDMQTPFEFSELRGRALVLPSLAHSLRLIVEHSARHCEIELDVQIEADSYSTLRQCVLGGCGWTILPLAAVRADIAPSRLSAAPLANPVPKRRLELSVPADRPVSRVTTIVRKKILQTTATLVRQGSWPGSVYVDEDVKSKLA